MLIIFFDNTLSNFGEYKDEPILYLVIDNVVLETYKSVDGITNFFERYTELSYSLFEDSKASNLNQSLLISDDLHFEYYYSESCSHCKLVKPDLLYFFLEHKELDFYLFDVGELGWGVTIEGFLGTPTLYVIDDNEILLTYVGPVEIQSFIDGYNQGIITFD